MHLLVVLAALSLSPRILYSQQAGLPANGSACSDDGDADPPLRAYTRQEAMLPMRDGVHLHAVILRPAEQRDAPPAGRRFCWRAHPTGWKSSIPRA